VPQLYRGILTGNTAGVARVAGENRTAALRHSGTATGARGGDSQRRRCRDDLLLTRCHRSGLAQTGVGAGLVLLGLILIINILARTILSRGIAVPRSMNLPGVIKAGFR